MHLGAVAIRIAVFRVKTTPEHGRENAARFREPIADAV
jgi:hypothetical protein